MMSNTKLERFREKPLPPPEPEVGEFTKIQIPACFHRHPDRATLVSILTGPEKNDGVVR